MNKRTCIIDGCERTHNARGWCLAHYKKWQKYGDPLGAAAPGDRKVCSADDCNRVMYARTFCKLHYKRYMTHGDLNHGRERRTCSVDGCSEFRHSNGYCIKHHARWKRHGSATARMPGEVIDGKRVCPGCQVDTRLDDYTPGSTGRCRKCVAEAKRARYVPIEHNFDPINCIQCGKNFKPTKSTILLCSEECVELRKSELDSDARHARRVRMRNARAERFGRIAVFERDGWICGICKHEIPKDLRHPSPRSASLDHVVPLSKGGSHSMANTQAAHLVCNLRKGTRLVT